MKLIDIINNTPIPYGYRIAFLTNFFREPLMRNMEKEFNLIRPEYTVLICVNFKSGCNAKDISEITEQPSNTVSRAVTSLLKKGFIDRQTDPNDARKSMLAMTDEGEILYKKIMDTFVTGEAHMTACLSKKELQQLDSILNKMCRHVPNWVKDKK